MKMANTSIQDTSEFRIAVALVSSGFDTSK
jgi:hypothetical protein